jgi:hypothetical protein
LFLSLSLDFCDLSPMGIYLSLERYTLPAVFGSVAVGPGPPKGRPVVSGEHSTSGGRGWASREQLGEGGLRSFFHRPRNRGCTHGAKPVHPLFHPLWSEAGGSQCEPVGGS